MLSPFLCAMVERKTLRSISEGVGFESRLAQVFILRKEDSYEEPN